ncbi:hypothetical protein WICPIJ_009450 [Wickerhamomyces pijperi]|uniref:phosphoadenylyl-sulfate reductase (thioredoxin) n=1 Tax=Wickerhamomyces pijperi TaxID=599730 RepID=A0A9P8PNT1_WICPI|nr:hypothetical protein WICPIJ_009450 [Wickerhamomyces pijperi]
MTAKSADKQVINIRDKVFLSEIQIAHINEILQDLSPQEIIKWTLTTFPNVYQTTALGLTGLVTIDILSKSSLGKNVELIFLDTLHHFPQTLDLLEKIRSKYPSNKLNVFKPLNASSESEFANVHGDNLWETDEDKYDYFVKVEPSQRAYSELDVVAVFTGRRKTQGGARNSLQILEIDGASNIIKINPFANWTFSQVHNYIKENDVPYNELLDLGYRSVGDYHSTQPVAEGEDERAGRWKGRAKTECGIHEASRFAQFLKENSSKEKA